MSKPFNSMVQLPPPKMQKYLFRSLLPPKLSLVEPVREAFLFFLTGLCYILKYKVKGYLKYACF